MRLKPYLYLLAASAVGLAWTAPSAHAEEEREITHKQNIRCANGDEKVNVELLLSGKEIVESSVKFSGPKLTPGLYKGQSFSAETYAYAESRNQIALVGNGYDVSTDNPVLIRMSFPRSILGGSAKKNKVKLYVHHHPGGTYNVTDPEKLYLKIKKKGGFSRAVADEAYRWQDGCWTYTKVVKAKLVEKNFSKLKSAKLNKFGDKIYGTYLESFTDESDGTAFAVKDEIEGPEEWGYALKQALSLTNQYDGLVVRFEKIGKKELSKENFLEMIDQSEVPATSEFTDFLDEMIKQIQGDRALEFYTALSSTESIDQAGIVVIDKKAREMIWLYSLRDN